MIILLPIVLLIWVTLATNRSILRTPLPTAAALSPVADHRLRRILYILALVAGIGGVIPLAGLPGQPWLAFAAPLASWTCPSGSLRGFGANASWPSAMMIAAAWPACLLPIYRIIRLSTTAGALWSRLLGGMGIALAYGLGLGLLMYTAFCRWPG